MTPKLAKRRDELAKLADEYIDADYIAGFDAAVAEMLPMLEQMAEALREISTSGGNKCWQHQQMAADALAAYHAWRG